MPTQVELLIKHFDTVDSISPMEAHTVYLFYPPHFNVIKELRQDADEINTRKLAKINNLEEQIKNIQENMSTVPEINTRRDI